MGDSSPGDAGSPSPQLKQLRDALERAIVSSLGLLDQLEAELLAVQTQEDIAVRKSKAAALIDVKKVPIGLPLANILPLCLSLDMCVLGAQCAFRSSSLCH